MKHHSYAFENRVDDLRRIAEQLKHESYLHLYGPSGIGKTHLVNQLKAEYYGDRQNIYIDFSDDRFRAACRSVGALLKELYRQLHGAPPQMELSEDELTAALAETAEAAGLVVLDNVDCMGNDVRRRFRQVVLPALERHIGDRAHYLRVVAVAPFELETLSGVGVVSFYPYLLEEFRGILQDLQTYKNLLRQACRRWAGGELDVSSPVMDRRLTQWAHELYGLTGGHPKAIEETLNYVGKEAAFARQEVFSEYRLAICQEVLTYLVEQQVKTWLQMPAYQLAFRQLWIFRYLSRSVFTQFLRQVRGDSNWHELNALAHEADYEPEHAYLWDRLVETPLLQHKGIRRRRFFSHQLTPIWRKLGNLILQVTDPVRYSILHRDAYTLFYRIASHKLTTSSYVRIACFIEALYHLSQTEPLAFTQEASDHLRQFIGDWLEQDKYSEEVLYDLIDLLESDQELGAELDRIGTPGTQRQLIDMAKQAMR